MVGAILQRGMMLVYSWCAGKAAAQTAMNEI